MPSIPKLAGWLAMVGAGLAAGWAGAAEELAAVPEDAIDALVDEDQVEHWQPQDRRALLQLLSRDARTGVRVAVTKWVARSPVPLAAEDHDWLVPLAADPVLEVREAFAAQVRARLERADPLERTYVVASWAVSPSDELRAAIARALEGAPPVVGARSALEHLLQDPTAEVRSAASRAIATRVARG